MANTIPIPEPPGLPLLGNVLDVDFKLPLKSLCELAEKYGEIYRMRFPGQSLVLVSSYALVNELCDEKRFPKSLQALREMRHGVHDGLLTAKGGEPNWGIAHRVLMPAFGPSSLRNMFDGMYDIASQLTMKWARHGKSTPIMVTEDFTRLTLDTIALCAMDFRFNSYYKDELHPFVAAMSNFLLETGNRARRLPLPSIFYRGKDRRFFSDIEVLRQTADEVLQARKAEGDLDQRKDLLSAMLDGVDPRTGQKISDQSILDNLITFLIAGHETTSGLLSFAFYFLMTHPDAYRKAQEEVDQVCGKGPIKFEHLPKLSYISAILRESLRLEPTIPVFNVTPKQDEIVGGRYALPAGELIILLLAQSQLDPKVYGEDCMEFNPERMLDENFDRLNHDFPNCWKPFGNGTRGCIGRPFAWQEALLVTAMLLQNFDFVLHDPDYSLVIKQTLTVKPKDLYMRAIPRDGLTATELEHKLAGTTPQANGAPAAGAIGTPKAGGSNDEGIPMSIYYGSNSGTCLAMAERLAANAFSHGFRASTVASVDDATRKLSQDEPVVIVTASYEGQPPDNASRFIDWLENLEDEQDLKDVSYAVFGCGHHDWASTFHRVPRHVDASMAQHGGYRIAPLGLSDVAEGNMFTDFETWEDDILWPAMMEKYDAISPEGPALSVEVTSPRTSTLRQDVQEARVVGTRTLTAQHASVQKQCTEVQLPSGMPYQAGDYLAVLPINPKEDVDRVMRHFHLSWDAHLTISANAMTALPENSSAPAVVIFGAYVELAQPATKRNIFTLAEFAADEATRSELRFLAQDDRYAAEITSKRRSVLDLLGSHPRVSLPLSTFLGMLPPMRARQYSISSSPLARPDRAVLTYSVLDAPHAAAAGQRRHVGVATSFLAGLRAGDALHVAVRPAHAAFRLPADAARTPVIMAAAGAGIAPFRGFVEERAALLGQTTDQSLAPALLFFGCRAPGADDLYRDELDAWEARGAVAVRRAYSREPAASDGCWHVQERLWRERDRVRELWEQGAVAYICGGRAVGDAVKEVLVDICFDAAREKGTATSREDTRVWLEGLKNTRYAVDVFE